MAAITQKIPLLAKVAFLHLIAVMLFIGASNVSKHPVLAYEQLGAGDKPAGIVVGKLPINGIPVSIKISRLGIDLPIVEGKYDAKANWWSLTTDSAQYAVGTALPNDTSGNTFIYGHNTPKVLGKTKQLQPEDIAEIATANGKVFRYRYTSDVVTNPDDTSLFTTPAAKSTLTILTCSGFWSQDRRLMHFEFEGVL